MNDRLSERHVQAIWYDAGLRPRHLVTRRGTEVRVVHPGDWNLGPGPDFRDAVLELGKERRRVRGDVEVHISPLDWDAHGHGTDPAYAHVIAHVTWRGGPEPDSLPCGSVAIWLGRFVSAETHFDPAQIDLSAYPYASSAGMERPCRGRLEGRPDRAAAELTAAGVRRLEGKARRYRQLGCTRENFYREVMNALGYSRNSSGFRSVAAAVPVECVVSEPENAAAAFLAAAQFAEWDRRNVRPGNSPEVRLRAAARLFTETEALQLDAATNFAHRDCVEMIRLLSAGHIMGRGRAAAIVANVVVPWALAAGRLGEVPDWLPPEDLSDPVRLTAYRLFGRDHNPAPLYARDDVRIQGLLQIHREFCLPLHPDCAACALAAPD